MQISPDQGQLLQFLLKLMSARKVLEIGTFTGYSALTMALALPNNATLVTCDIHAKWMEMAKIYWAQAKVAHKIDYRLAPATETLRKLIDDGQSNSFDFAFIDANKRAYETYFTLCFQLIKPGGVIALDDTLWHGKVADSHDNNPMTTALRHLNQTLYTDKRLSLALLPIGNGLTLLHKTAVA